MARTFQAQRPFNLNGQNFITNQQWTGDGPVPEVTGLMMCKLGFSGLTGGPGVPGAFLAFAADITVLADDDGGNPNPPQPEPPGEGGGGGEGGEVQPMSSTEGPTRRPSRR